MAAERVITRATRENLDAIMTIERQCFADPWPISSFMTEFSHPWSYFRLIGVPDGGAGLEVDGFIICWVLPEDLHLLNLAIRPLARRHGLAKRLLNEALDDFARRGGGTASLEVRPSNPIAKKLYRSFGFAEISVRKKYYQKDQEDAIVMTLAVPDRRGME